MLWLSFLVHSFSTYRRPFWQKTIHFHFACKNAIFDNYNLGVFSKNGVRNSNCPYFAYMYVYMSRGCTTEMSIIACLVFLIKLTTTRHNPLTTSHTNSLLIPYSIFPMSTLSNSPTSILICSNRLVPWTLTVKTHWQCYNTCQSKGWLPSNGWWVWCNIYWEAVCLMYFNYYFIL